MKLNKTLEWLCIALLTVVGIVHLFLMSGEYNEAHYMGMLFAANFFGAILAAVGIYRRSLWGWGLGLGVAAGSLIGYILSRTVGMPGIEVEAWLQPLGILSLFAEAVFIVLVIQMQPWKRQEQNIAN